MTGQEPHEAPEGSGAGSDRYVPEEGAQQQQDQQYSAQQYDAQQDGAQQYGQAAQDQQTGSQQGNWQAQPQQGNWQAGQNNQAQYGQQQYGAQQPQQGNWQAQQGQQNAQQGYGAQAGQGAWQGQPQGNWQGQQGQQGPNGPGAGEKFSAAVGKRTHEAATSLKNKSLPQLMGGILAVLGVLQLIAGLMAWYKFEASMTIFGMTAGGEGNINGFGRAKAIAQVPFEGKQTQTDWVWQGTVAEIIVLALVAAAAVLAFRNIKLKTVGILATASGVLGLVYSIFFAVALKNAISGDGGEALDMLSMVEHGRGFGYYLSILLSIAIGAMGVWLIVKKPAEIDAQRNKFLSDVATRSNAQANKAQQPAQPQQGNWQGQQGAWQSGQAQQQGNWQAGQASQAQQQEPAQQVQPSESELGEQPQQEAPSAEQTGQSDSSGAHSTGDTEQDAAQPKPEASEADPSADSGSTATGEDNTQS